jgi:hypothetical protein
MKRLLIGTALLVLAACTPSAAGSPSATASPTPAPPSLTAQKIFAVDVPGYVYVELPRRLQRQAAQQFRDSSGLQEEAEFSIRSFVHGQTQFAAVVVVAVDPGLAALPGTEQGFVGGLEQSAGVAGEVVPLGRIDGHVVEGEEQTIVAWKDENLYVSVVAEDRASSVTAARAIAQAVY